jgi:hypothetical protein
MNYNIIDGNNEKLRSVGFDEIEKIVEENFKETIQNEYELNDTDDKFDENDLLCLKMDYEINYLKKDLIHIMKYYGLSIRKKNKEECIDDIIEFELNPENEFIVDHRKTLWFYLEELENDEYLSKFIKK